jgi:hypothetical protein
MRALFRQAGVTKFERRMRRLILHRAFVGSYLGVFILFFIATAVFSSSHSLAESLFQLVVICASLYILLIAVLWGSQAVVGYLERDAVTGVWMSCWTVAFLALAVFMGLGALRSIFGAAR